MVGSGAFSSQKSSRQIPPQKVSSAAFELVTEAPLTNVYGVHIRDDENGIHIKNSA